MDNDNTGSAQQQGRDEILRGLAAFFSESVHLLWSNDEIASCLEDMITEPACASNPVTSIEVPAAQQPLQAIRSALFEPDESDAYDNLEGALIDIERLSEQGKTADQVCIRTIRRVLTQLNAVHNIFASVTSTAEPDAQSQARQPMATASAEIATAAERTMKADYKIGWWLSGALEDPAVCAEMKVDINAWFEAHQPGLVMPALVTSTNQPTVPAGHELCRSCGRLFKWGETCSMGGCPCGGDV